MIAGLPKAPSRFNPIADPEQAVVRRNYVLRRMLELGYITREEHDAAREAPVSAKVDENGTVVPDLEPFPFQQGLADIAHMAVARIGLCGQIGDAPCSIRVAQQDAQDGCRLQGENGAQRAGLGAGLVSATARSM